jgi:hypothetical protein
MQPEKETAMQKDHKPEIERVSPVGRSAVASPVRH